MVGVVGELLITAGVIVALFAVWQLFVTDMQVAGETNAVNQKFEQTLPEIPNRISKDERKTPPPQWDKTPTHGDILGTLHIPTWEAAKIPVEEGTDASILDLGLAGHYVGTALPGEIGNFSVAAHRRSYGSNFRRLDELQVGDVVVMQTTKAWLVYKMTSNKIVYPSEGDVIWPVPGQEGVEPTERLMTMTTCHPEYGNSQRFIVHLKLDHWVPIDSGIPKELWKG